jgi:hypothetical protein
MDESWFGRSSRRVSEDMALDTANMVTSPETRP